MKNSKFLRFFALSVIGLGFLAFVSSCNNEEEMDVSPDFSSLSMNQFIAGNQTFSILNDAINRANLGTVVANNTITIFAPNNGAFAAIGINSPEDLDAFTSAELVEILSKHIVEGRVTSNQLNTGEITALNGATLQVEVNGGVRINNAEVITPDIILRNGVIHTINAVLVPAEEEPAVLDLVSTAQAAGLTTLLTAVNAAGLGQALLDAQAITVFAPTNQAFDNLIAALDGVTDLNSLVAFLGGTEGLANVLQYHVVAGAVFAADVPTTPTQVTTLNGESFTVQRTGNNVTVTDLNGNTFNVVASDVEITNGVVHVIDGVLIPELETQEESNTIVDIAVANPDFSYLVAALTKVSAETSTDVVGLLSGAGNFTVFAPNNQAFINAGFATIADIQAADANTLLAVLTYHVLSSRVAAANIPQAANTQVSSLGGNLFATRTANNNVFINGIRVIAADIEADNGIIHVVESVLLPPSGNIVDVAVSNPNFSFLAAAVVRASSGSANLAEILSGNGPFTVFAPTNQAFIDAGFATIDAINAADPETLIPILTYHVIGARVFSSDLVSGSTPATVNGQTVTITLNGGAQVRGNGNDTASNIVATNVVTTNGVIHVIDRVLLPGIED
jgi:transforming growth factor-beta-induced protein